MVRNQGKQCMGDLEKIKIVKKLGEGSFGNVFLGEIGTSRLAVKQGMIKKSILKKPYSNNVDGWGEVNILLNIINPLIENGICPNLPLMYKDFYCPECDFTFSRQGLLGTKRTRKTTACTITLVELATGGTLEQFLQQDGITEEQANVMIFQVMAGLHALQNQGVFHNDIKAVNILIYDIELGGCYEYVIMGKRYYIPNIGKIAVINDFGVSNSYLSTRRYGSYMGEMKVYDYGRRRYYIHRNRVFPVFVRGKNVKYTNRITFEGYTGDIYLANNVLSNDKLIVGESENTEYFSYESDQYEPLTVKVLDDMDKFPAGEFAIDIIDVLYTFVGGRKRGGQPGDHPDTKIPARIKNKLLRYCILGTEAMNIELRHELAHMRKYEDLKPFHFLAGLFISHFFKDMFSEKSGSVIETYKIS